MFAIDSFSLFIMVQTQVEQNRERRRIISGIRAGRYRPQDLEVGYHVD
jgi:hypothetical protein